MGFIVKLVLMLSAAAGGMWVWAVITISGPLPAGMHTQQVAAVAAPARTDVLEKMIAARSSYEALLSADLEVLTATTTATTTPL
jgi:hypothetical protein